MGPVYIRRNAILFKSYVVVVVVVVEASAPKVYPRVTLASARTLSGSVVRTLRGEEGLPNMFCLVASINFRIINALVPLCYTG